MHSSRLLRDISFVVMVFAYACHGMACVSLSERYIGDGVSLESLCRSFVLAGMVFGDWTGQKLDIKDKLDM